MEGFSRQKLGRARKLLVKGKKKMFRQGYFPLGEYGGFIRQITRFLCGEGAEGLLTDELIGIDQKITD